MKIVQINCTCGVGSTGKICVAVSQLLSKKGIENYILYSSGQSDYPLGIRYMSPMEIKREALRSRIAGDYGYGAVHATRRLLAHLDRINPDVVHLHNLHSHNCHLGMLLAYLKEKKKKVFWTFHDCWSFTAYCPYFDMVGCDQWRTGCYKCVQRRGFSWLFDRSASLYERKQADIQGLDLTIVTPSQWLKNLVEQSFFGQYPVKVIHNGIDLAVFSPKESHFREQHQLKNKIIVLGVAFGWGVRKGLDVFVELAKRLDEQYQIILVGTDDKVDEHLPPNIISIHRTQNQQELAEIYSAADVFVNPTREENYPTVNMEALACGTPVVTFRTGGSPEMLDETCGSVVPCDDVDALEKEIIRVCEEKPYSKKQCVRKAQEFDQSKRFKEYVELYEKISDARSEER